MYNINFVSHGDFIFIFSFYLYFVSVSWALVVLYNSAIQCSLLSFLQSFKGRLDDIM